MDILNLIPGENEKNAMKEFLRTWENNLEDYLKAQTLQAKLIKSRYDALIQEGFTTEQALELCKNM